MKPLIWLVFFMFMVCGMLGFSLAQSDLFNPNTSAVHAEIDRTNAEVEREKQLATIRLEEQRLAAELAADLHRSRLLADTLFVLSAVGAACLLALTIAVVYWLLRRAGGPLPRP